MKDTHATQLLEGKALVYRQEFKHLDADPEHVVRTTTPENIDLMFLNDDKKLVVVESKTPDDLYSSIRMRRLARQIRAMREVGDIVVVLVRGLWPEYLDRIWWGTGPGGQRTRFKESKPIERCRDLWQELSRLQSAGVYILHGPYLDEDIPAWICEQRSVLTERDTLKALAGTDKRPPKERKPGWLLRRIPGVGMTLSQRLHKALGSTQKVLRASEAQLKKAGAPVNVIKNIKDAQK